MILGKVLRSDAEQQQVTDERWCYSEFEKFTSGSCA